MTGVAVPARVTSVDRLSPHFVRITLTTSPQIGGCQPVWDQRIKLLFPTPGAIRLEGPNWYADWLAADDDRRPPMRTYTIRELHESPDQTLLAVDFVVHPISGTAGPAVRWATAAQPGDELTLIGPLRGEPAMGKEFAPGAARHVLLAGDETAAPAIASILADLPEGLTGTALIEVPTSDDVLSVTVPEGMTLSWLPRDGAPHGSLLQSRLIDLLGTPVGGGDEVRADADAEGMVWETPTYSATGEPVLAETIQPDNSYYWIAGECTVVAELRRRLVRDFRIARHQIAFMGYWRQGVAARG